MSDPISLAQARSGFDQCRQYAALIAFNDLPSRYLHPSWRVEFADPGLADFLFDGPYAHALLSDYIRLKTGLPDILDRDWRHPAMQIGMHLNAEQLRELGCRLALILIGQPIRHALSNAAVNAWIAALGEPLYRFACKHAPLLGGADFMQSPEWRFSVVSPETIAGQADAFGARFLTACTHLLDAAVGQRLRFKLPREIAHSKKPAINPAHYPEVWTWINRIWSSIPVPASPSITPVREAYK